jgi:hypothetical protein
MFVDEARTATAKTSADTINALRRFNFAYNDITRLLNPSSNFRGPVENYLGIMPCSGDKRRNGKAMAVDDDRLAAPKSRDD